MQVGKIKNRAKKYLVVNKYHPLLLNAAMTGILVVILFLTFALSHISGWSWLAWYGLVLLVAFYVFTAPVEYSAVDFYLRAYNLKNIENFKLFEGYKKENLWRSVLVRLIRTGMGIGFTVLLIVPGVLFMMRTSFVYFVLRGNPKTKAWDAIRESNQLVKGHTAEIFKICCSFIGWFLLGIITFGLAFIYVSPYYHSVKSVYFRHILMGINDAGSANAAKTTAPKNNAELNSEIEKLESRLKALKNAAAAGQTVYQKTTVAPTQRTAQSAPKTETVEIVRDAKVKQETEFVTEQTVPEQPVDTGDGPLVLDEVGEINLTSGDRVEEIEIPAVKETKVETPNQKRENVEFVTREIEIMENESFEDFKARVARLRKERETVSKTNGGEIKANRDFDKASLTDNKVNAADGKSAVADNKVNAADNKESAARIQTNTDDKARRLTREEILEKLKQDRKNR